MKTYLGLLASFALIGLASAAHADKLDDIISSGTLRCGVVLDVPPEGMRDEKNEPVGFSVDYCNDLAKALGVTAEIVETPYPDRIPALVSDRTDVAIAGTSDTLERAKTVGFSNPYLVFKFVIVSRKDNAVSGWDGLKGHPVGAVAGTVDAIELEKRVKEINDPDTTFRAYQSQADALLALSQGQIHATTMVSSQAAVILSSGKYPDLALSGEAPFGADYVGIATLRQEYGLINYLNLFISRQVRSGRYAELYKAWFGSDTPPDLTIPGVYR